MPYHSRKTPEDAQRRRERVPMAEAVAPAVQPQNVAAHVDALRESAAAIQDLERLTERARAAEGSRRPQIGVADLQFFIM